MKALNVIRPLSSSVINKVKNVVMAGAGIEDKFKVKEDSEKVDFSKGWIDVSISNNDNINSGEYVITTNNYETNTGATYYYSNS